MKISEYLDELQGWDDEVRERYLRPLLAVLSGVTRRTLVEHQRQWLASYDEADYKAFKQSLDEKFIECLRLEISPFGVIVREQLGLKPLTLGTDILIETIEVIEVTKGE